MAVRIPTATGKPGRIRQFFAVTFIRKKIGADESRNISYVYENYYFETYFGFGKKTV